MIIYLIGQKSLNSIKLPTEIMGDYWISNIHNGYEERLVNISGKNQNWQIKSNQNAKIINPKCINFKNGELEIIKNSETIIDMITLKENSIYYLCIGNFSNVYVLYCFPKSKRDFICLDASKQSLITIGNGLNNQICYNINLIKNVHTQINCVRNTWIIEDFGGQFGTYVNGEPLNNSVRDIKNGDVIFIMGLIIIIVGKKIYINNPLNRVTWNTANLNPIEENPEKQKFVYNVDDEKKDIDIYSGRDYFFRPPRITSIVEHERIKIDPPPTLREYEEKSILLTLGTSLAMSVTMLVTLITSINSMINGSSASIARIITSISMLFGILIMPLLTRKAQKKQSARNEEKRQVKYKEYLNSKIKVINKIIEKQRNILMNNYLSTEECARFVLEKNPRLWERRITDSDFLFIRLGTGDFPLDVDIQYPEDKFTIEQDNLIEMAREVVEDAKFIKDAPITFPLAQNSISAIIGKDKIEVENFIQNIVLQLVALHSYQELKLVFLVNNTYLNWDYVKILPHVWDDERRTRFFADNYSDMQEISTYLNDKFMARIEKEAETYETLPPYYLIITDDYEKIENLNIIGNILKSDINKGFNILCISDKLTHLPDECKSFIYLNGRESEIYNSEMGSNPIKFTFDKEQTFFVDKIIKSVANIPIKSTTSNEIPVKKTFGFLEMFNVGRIEQLNILDRWNNNDSTKSLKAQIGLDSSGMPIYLDIHEKFHGPHGLIAGSTGSGKSEFIITYILSLAINYSPEDVTFVLIDYKGGGLAGAFKKRDIKLPHLVGTITNIDTNGLQRSLVSIKSELTRRQIIFNEARDLIDEGTIDIYKYQKLYKKGIVDKPVPHLLIICDEFAELKQQQNDFMEELMSVSRIGRSLGVHLILATQKPAGIVNDQIRSNSKFSICLKVQDKADSNDVIKRPDAAYLKNPGQFYLNVGNEEYFVLGQSAWSGAPYFPTDIIKKKVDTSIEFISNTGTIITDIDDQVQKNVNSDGEQLTNVVKYLSEIAKKENIKMENLWLDAIPETIFVKDLRQKYKWRKERNAICPIIGEFDDPNRQRQGLLCLDISNGGNAIIFGNAESGKETLLSTIVYELITSYTVEEVWLYLLDFGTESLKVFNGCPHVGDIVFLNEEEKISRLFDMLQQEIKNRKEILSNYNGDYGLYLKTSNESMPRIIVILNNYDIFLEDYNTQFDEQLQSMTREGLKYGINFIVTVNSSNSMRYRLAQNFKQKIVLQMNKDSEYLNILEKVGKRTIPAIFGRGLTCLDGKEIYEIQVAKICPAEQWYNKIQTAIEEAKKLNNIIAKKIPVLPKIVTYDILKPYLNNLESIPIGIEKDRLEVISYDFEKTFMTAIISKNIEEATNFAGKVSKEIMQIKEAEIEIFDSEKIIKDDLIEVKETFDQLINEIENVSDKKARKHKICVIIGMSKLIAEVKVSGKNLKQIFMEAEKTKKYSFIIVESANKLKSFGFEDWYKYYITGDTGIWVGSGVADQYIINFNINRRILMQNCDCSFGYVSQKGKANMIKLLEIDGQGDGEDE